MTTIQSAAPPPVSDEGSTPAGRRAPSSLPHPRGCCGQCPATEEAYCPCTGARCLCCQGCVTCCECDRNPDLFRCAECAALRLQPPAGYDDADYRDGEMVPCGNPLCTDCARRGSSCPEYAYLIADGGPAHA